MKYRKSEAKDYTREHMKGIWAAIPCAFNEKGEVDEEAVRRDMRYYVDELKIDGFFCGGLVSECWSLTLDERKRLQEITVEECAGKAQVIAHTAHMSADATVELTLHAEAVGADYAIVMNPLFAAKSEEHVRTFFTYLCERVNIGVSLFNTSIAGVTLSPRFIAELAEIENICCVKNAQPLDHHIETMRLVGDKIVCSEPSEKYWLLNHAHLGQQVFMSSPEPYLYQKPGKLTIKEYTDLIDQGKLDEAKKLSDSLAELRRLYYKWIMTPWMEGRLTMAYIKYWSELLGMSGGRVRPFLRDLTPKEKEEMKADLTRAGLIS